MKRIALSVFKSFLSGNISLDDGKRNGKKHDENKLKKKVMFFIQAADKKRVAANYDKLPCNDSTQNFTFFIVRSFAKLFVFGF